MEHIKLSITDNACIEMPEDYIYDAGKGSLLTQKFTEILLEPKYDMFVIVYTTLIRTDVTCDNWRRDTFVSRDTGSRFSNLIRNNLSLSMKLQSSPGGVFQILQALKYMTGHQMYSILRTGSLAQR